MLMISSRQDGEHRQTGGDTRSMMRPIPPDEMYDREDGMESRYRRRYKNGRFAPRSQMYEPESRGGSERRGRERSGNRQPTQIGFRYEMDGDRPRGAYPTMHEPGRKSGGMKAGREPESYGRMDEELAEEWTAMMHNADGTKGAHWQMEQTEKVMEMRNLDCDPMEFFVAVNMMYSDYSKVARKHGVNTLDFYADMALAFLDDADAVEDKLMAYYECVVDA